MQPNVPHMSGNTWLLHCTQPLIRDRSRAVLEHCFLTAVTDSRLLLTAVI
jgi:hypothetical protein